MNRPRNSTTGVLTRPDRTSPSSSSRDGDDRSPDPPPAAPADARPGGPASTIAEARRTGNARPVPRGWGSHAERRLMLQALLVFIVLGLYASAFVLLGHVLST